MENKTFELTKMYDEFSDRFDSIREQGLTELRKKTFQRSSLLLKMKSKNDIRALYDGYRQANEGVERLLRKLLMRFQLKSTDMKSRSES